MSEHEFNRRTKLMNGYREILDIVLKPNCPAWVFLAALKQRDRLTGSNKTESSDCRTSE